MKELVKIGKIFFIEKLAGLNQYELTTLFEKIKETVPKNCSFIEGKKIHIDIMLCAVDILKEKGIEKITRDDFCTRCTFKGKSSCLDN